MTTRTQLIEWANAITRNVHEWEQLRRSSAGYCHVNDAKGKSYYILKSYSAIVAVYSESTGAVYEFDRYSTTTTQHVRKFARDMSADRITHLYIRSDKCVETRFGYASLRPTIEIETINK